MCAFVMTSNCPPVGR